MHAAQLLSEQSGFQLLPNSPQMFSQKVKAAMLLSDAASKGVRLEFSSDGANVDLALLLSAYTPWRNFQLTVPQAEELCMCLIGAIKAARREK
jgi:hypothetical protein